MSGLPLSVKRTLVTCSNPSCERYGHPGDKAPHKCANCNVRYKHFQSCQRRHWRQHKEFCNVWAQSSANNGHTSVAQLRLKMAHLIWLLRGIPEYAKCMFEEYDYWRKLGARGFIELKFYYWEHLFNAIKVIEELPVYQDMPFAGMPGTPSYTPPGAKQLTLPLRKITAEHCVRFHEAVQDYMRFTENQMRPNLQQALKVAKQGDDLLVISISVVLEGTYSTHIYDYLYRSISWQPSDKGPVAAVPVPAK